MTDQGSSKAEGEHYMEASNQEAAVPDQHYETAENYDNTDVQEALSRETEDGPGDDREPDLS